MHPHNKESSIPEERLRADISPLLGPFLTSRTNHINTLHISTPYDASRTYPVHLCVTTLRLSPSTAIRYAQDLRGGPGKSRCRLLP